MILKNKSAFLNTSKWENWDTFFLEQVQRKVNVKEFKVELRDIVMEYGELVLIRMGMFKLLERRH